MKLQAPTIQNITTTPMQLKEFRGPNLDSESSEVSHDTIPAPPKPTNPPEVTEIAPKRNTACCVGIQHCENEQRHYVPGIAP
jgi:hypothetical protein